MTEKKSYFAAANTVNGFVSYYNDIFGKCERVYIIKGGSGTGKSRFMREIADYAGGKESCESVEYFYCSFDPGSLDGIIINDRVAVIDGTAPHIYEPTVPGAKEDLLDFGVFWNSKMLGEKKDELSSLMGRKKECFERAYKYLSSYGSLWEMRRSILINYLDTVGLRVDAAKRVSELEEHGTGEIRIRPVRAFGMKGIVETSRKSADNRITVKDSLGIGYLWLEAIILETKKYHLPIEISFDPLFAYSPSKVVVDNKTEFSLTTDDDADLDMTDFIKNGGLVSAEQNEKIKL